MCVYLRAQKHLSSMTSPRFQKSKNIRIAQWKKHLRIYEVRNIFMLKKTHTIMFLLKIIVLAILYVEYGPYQFWFSQRLFCRVLMDNGYNVGISYTEVIDMYVNKRSWYVCDGILQTAVAFERAFFANFAIVFIAGGWYFWSTLYAPRIDLYSYICSSAQ